MSDAMLSHDEAALTLGVSQEALTELVRADDVRAYRFGRHLRYSVSDVDGCAALRRASTWPAPRRGVYFIRPGSQPFVKIGHATDVARRLDTLQTAHYEPLRVLRVVDGDRQRERWLHARFAAQHVRGEWFRIDGALAVYLLEIER